MQAGAESALAVARALPQKDIVRKIEQNIWISKCWPKFKMLNFKKRNLRAELLNVLGSFFRESAFVVASFTPLNQTFC